MEGALADCQKKVGDLEKRMEVQAKEMNCWKENRHRFERMRLELSSRSNK